MILRKAVPLSFVMLFVAGCGAKSFDYHPPQEIPEGPGMFSGDKGAFVLSSSEKDGKVKDQKPAASALPEDFREFQEYREFRRWKESVQGASEYREFQDWREWKAYRTWKQGQAK